MDGFKRRLSDSIQVRLSIWLSLVILIVAIVAGIFSFVVALDEANELQDDILRQVASLIDRQEIPVPHLENSGRVKIHKEGARVIVQYLADTPAHENNVTANAPLLLPQTLSDGIHTLTVRQESFRVLVKTMASGERVAVAQETDMRDEIARNSALNTTMPFLILMPLLLLVVAKLVRKIFKPMASLAIEIDHRGEQELHPVAQDNLPLEIRPFIRAINRLLARVAQSMDTQRRFVADAAHELRSPLTALSLQAERLADSDISDTARERLVALRQGIERERNLLDQMLTLARTQTTPSATSKSISVQYVYRCVLEDLMPMVEAKHIDIGVEGENDTQLLVNEIDLITLVKNLVDNAIRYSPAGGRIDLSLETRTHQAILRISDTGPGIPVDERERIFDPFYRILGSNEVGSGLGLSIVKTIVDRIGAAIKLKYTDAPSQSGLTVIVSIPMTAFS